MEKDADGYLRPEDWAQTLTSLGTMVEPFHIGFVYDQSSDGQDKAEIDWEDDMRVVHDLRVCSHEEAFKSINGGVEDPPLHGGHMYARDGR